MGLPASHGRDGRPWGGIRDPSASWVCVCSEILSPPGLSVSASSDPSCSPEESPVRTLNHTLMCVVPLVPFMLDHQLQEEHQDLRGGGQVRLYLWN